MTKSNFSLHEIVEMIKMNIFTYKVVVYITIDHIIMFRMNSNN